MPEAESGKTFGEQLELLFDAVRREDGSVYSKREVAAAVGLSKTHLYNLINGEREPSHATVKALAEFFGVQLDYFSDTERGRELAQQYSLLAKFGEGKLRALARGAEKLSPEQLTSVIEYIEFQASRDHPSR
ncbi:helix-turn-helix domain-containing protein [Saccharopolyspora sp. NPDC003752]